MHGQGMPRRRQWSDLSITNVSNHNVAGPGGHPKFADLRKAEIGELQVRWQLCAIFEATLATIFLI